MTRTAPRPHLLRDPDGQRALLPRSLAATAALHAGEVDWTWLRANVGEARLWAERLAQAGVAPWELDADTLALLPPLDRATLASSWRDAVLVPDDPSLVAVRSSGSTGQPVRVLRDRYDCLHAWAVLRYVAERLGVTLRRPSVVFLCTLPGGLEWSAPVPIFDDARLRRISTVRPRPLERLIAARPALINTSPAGLHWLLQQPADAVRPALITSSAQHLPDELRDAVEDRFGAPVVDLYALTETGPVAWTCPHRARHVLADVHVASVDGDLLVTRLRPSPLILLRYATGDRGLVEHTTCPCGLVGPVLRDLRGRASVDFVTPDGRSVDAWRYAAFFKHTSLHDFRLVQTGPTAFRLEGAVPVDTAPLAEALRRDGFGDVEITAAQVEGWAGKAVCFTREGFSP